MLVKPKQFMIMRFQTTATIDEEIIMPIDEIDLDEMVEEPIYNLSQSENTLYNNVIYDESGSDDVITPIYADEEYKEEHGITDEDLEEYYGFDYDDEEPSALESEEDMDYITPEVTRDVEILPRPTSIASTNPIASKRDVHSNLSRPHKKSEIVNIPKPRAKAEAKPVSEDITTAVPAADIPAAIPRPVPKAKGSVESDSLPVGDLVSETERVPPISEIVESPEETIKIDPNNPESIPIPKLLNSYVICEKGILTSQEAFEEVASHSKEEILLEAPTVKDMGERFLSNLSKTKSRVIIEEFDLEDISYVLLLSFLIKKGVEIKTLPSVDSFNLIGDTSHALLISNSIDESDFEYGAVYDDEESVKNIKELFESSWKLANDLDISAIVGSE